MDLKVIYQTVVEGLLVGNRCIEGMWEGYIEFYIFVMFLKWQIFPDQFTLLNV